MPPTPPKSQQSFFRFLLPNPDHFHFTTLPLPQRKGLEITSNHNRKFFNGKREREGGGGKETYKENKSSDSAPPPPSQSSPHSPALPHNSTHTHSPPQPLRTPHTRPRTRHGWRADSGSGTRGTRSRIRGRCGSGCRCGVWSRGLRVVPGTRGC